MRFQILMDQLKHFTEMLISLKTLRDSLNELPDEMELTVSFENDKNQPGGMIKDGKLFLPDIMSGKQKTVKQRKAEIDNDLTILKPRIKKIKEEMVKELEKEDE